MNKHILVTLATQRFINAERETVRLVNDVEMIFSNNGSITFPVGLAKAVKV